MMKITGETPKSYSHELECEEHLMPVRQCTAKVEAHCAEPLPFAVHAGRCMPWMTWLSVAVLVFVLVLIMLWVIDPRDLRKDDDGEYCDEKDVVKYLVIALLAALIAVSIVYGCFAK